MMGQEKVAVCFIIISIYLKFAYLGTAFDIYCRCFAFLLGKDSCNVQFPELHFGLQPEKTVTACYQSPGKRKRDIPYLNLFNDLIIFPCILKFGPVLKFEHGISVVIDPKLHLITNCTGHIHHYLFLEIKCRNGLELF